MNLVRGQIFSFTKRGLKHFYGTFFSVFGLFVLCSSPSVLAQNANSLKKEGDGHFQNEQYYQAAQYYQVAVGLVPDDAMVNYRLAESYREIFNYPLAANYYEITLRLDPFSYPLAQFYLARMNKAVGQFRLAKGQFDSFVQQNQSSQILEESIRNRFLDQAKIEAEGCVWAQQQLASPFNEQGFINLPPPVNSIYNDYAVDVLEHDTTLTITSGRKGAKGSLIDNRYGDYFTDVINLVKTTEWQNTDLKDRFETVNTKFNDGAGCYNSTRDAYYFTSCYEGNAFCRLYITRLVNNRWTRPKALGEQINLPGYDNRHPAISITGDTLYFTSNRPGGFGGNDIWMSLSDGNGDWQSPTLVPHVNTAFNEVAPYLHSDGTLFFSSDGWVGFGGFDIFSISPLSNQPQNLGIPINSGFDDSFFTLGDKLGYLSSNRTGGQGKFDIYQFPWPGDPQALMAQFKGTADGERLRSRIRQYGNRTLVAARDEDQFYYDNLTAEERAQLDRILAARRLSGASFNPSNLAPDDFKYYQKLDIETKAIIERLAQRELLTLQTSNQEMLDILQPRDLEYYEGVSAEERATIDRIISAKVEDRREAISTLPPAERDYWQNSAPEGQQRIENLALDESLDEKQQLLNSNRLKLSERMALNNEVLEQNDIQAISQVDLLSTGLMSGYSSSIEGMEAEQKLFYQRLDHAQKDDLHKLALRQYIQQSNLSSQAQQELISKLGLPELAEVINTWSPEERSMATDIVGTLASAIMNQSGGLKAQLAETFEAMPLEDRVMVELQAQQNLLSALDRDSDQKLQEIADLRSDIQTEIPQEGLSDQDQEIEHQLAQRLAARNKTFAIRKLQPRDAYFFEALSPLQSFQIQKLSDAIYHADNDIAIEQDLLDSFSALDKTYFGSLPSSEQQLLSKVITEGLQISDDSAEEYLSQLDSVELARVQRLRAQYLQSNSLIDEQPSLLDEWNSTELARLSPASIEFLKSQSPSDETTLKSIFSKGLVDPQQLTTEEQQYLSTLTPQQRDQLEAAVAEYNPGVDNASTQIADSLETTRAADTTHNVVDPVIVTKPSQLENHLNDWHEQLSPEQQNRLASWGDEQIPMAAEIVQKSTLDFDNYQGETLQFLQSRSLEELRDLQGMIDVYTELHPQRIPAQYRQGPTSISGKLVDNNQNDMPGQPIELMDDQGQVVATTTTDDKGKFSFIIPDYRGPLTIRRLDGMPFKTNNWQITAGDNEISTTDLTTSSSDPRPDSLDLALTPETQLPLDSTDSLAIQETQQSQESQDSLDIATIQETIQPQEDPDTTGHIIESQDPGQPLTTLSSNQSDTARVYFDFDRFQLRPEAKKTIQSVADFLKAYNQAEVIVGGHTDHIGSSQYNQRLSEKRSNAAANYLTQLAPQVSTRIEGFGESQPRFSNGTPFGRQYNRRVEIMVIAPTAYRAEMRTVLVKPGVSLTTLATNLGLSEDLILAWNGITDRNFRAYQPIRLPVTLNFEQYHRLVFDPKSKSDDYKLAKYHLVKLGDTFSALAIQYDTTVQRLEELNKIQARDLKAGTRIRVR